MINFKHLIKEGYKTNSLGYRTSEFNLINWNESYIMLGCSFTFGEGIKDDELTVAKQLEINLKKNVVNLGAPGSGIDIQLYNIIDVLKEHTPLGIFMLWPPMHRYAIFNDNIVKTIGPWSEEPYIRLLDKDNLKTHNEYNVYAIRKLLEFNNIPIFEISFNKDTHHLCKSNINDFLDRGYDGDHWGEKTAKRTASQFYNLWKNYGDTSI